MVRYALIKINTIFPFKLNGLCFSLVSYTTKSDVPESPFLFHCGCKCHLVTITDIDTHMHAREGWRDREKFITVIAN